MKYYALKSKTGFAFSCVSKTEDELKTKIKSAYWNEYGMRPKGTSFTMDDFLSDVNTVTIEINKLDIKL